MTLYLAPAVMLLALILFWLCSEGTKRTKAAQLALWSYVVALLVVLATFSGVVEFAVHATKR